jgi:hypothetical protein
MTLPGIARAAGAAGPAAPGAPGGATGAAGAAPVAVPAQAAGLTPARQTTYRALVDTVLAEPGLRLDPAAADAAASEFATRYATWPADAQRRADATLDALERSTGGAAFGKLGRPARTAHLRACGRPTDDDPVGAERARLDLAQGAMSLAAVTVGPSGGELDRPLDSV